MLHATTTTLRRALTLGLALAVLLPAVGQAASIQGPRRSALERLEEGDAIRNRLLLRGGRFEVAPSLGFTMNDAFRRNILVGANLAYNFTDSLALGASIYGGFGFDSGLAESVASERPDRTKAGAFSDVKLLASVEFIYTPLIGKFAVFGRTVFNYDLHLIAGAGGSLVGGGEQLDDFAFAPVLGVGLRTFLTPGMFVNVQIRDYIYSSALNAVPSAEGTGKVDSTTEWSNNFALTFSYGFSFPQEPKLSN
ncbi:MAG: outer membrane beta-barrel domain-containing protein [Myxococcales bacterium]|nr:outer membrane beta-barrel domain-containing protein [Myxococcales bacterium]MCB9521888.1 outer membrane beta-barrel domain-containing protein [Myxococcales bacterium]